MCRNPIVAGIMLLLLASSFSTVSAQPFVAVYFCGSGADFQEQQVCQGNGVLDTLCIVAQNYCPTDNIQFAIDYPPSITWVADFDTQPATFGATPTGFNMSWTVQQPPGSVFICHVLIQWNCDNCDPPNNDPVRVVPHLVTGFLWSTSCGVLQVLVPMVGLTSLVCATVPVEATTWGRVKELYSQ